MAASDPEVTGPARVRFAPSPTGSLHVGGARTALFNWLIARHTGGAFVLRMEDTDRERSTRESEAEILRVLAWLGLDWDEGPFRQSERGAVYARAVERLREAGAVYPGLRDRRGARGPAGGRPGRQARPGGARPPRPRPRSRRLEGQGLRPVWRFAVDVEGQTVIEDYVRGTVTFEHAAIEDFVVARSDGTPTYNLAAAVDDLEMGITHVIRGRGPHLEHAEADDGDARARRHAARLRARPAHPRPRQEAPQQAPRGRLGRGPRGGRLRPGPSSTPSPCSAGASTTRPR